MAGAPWHLILILLSIIFAVLATAGVNAHPRFAWFPASFLCFLLATLA